METEKIYIEDYTKGKFYTDPDIPDEYKLDCALSVLKYMLTDMQKFTFYYFTVSYGAIFYLAYLFVKNYGNPLTGWREKADIYFDTFSRIREPRIEKALEAIGIDTSKYPESEFRSSKEDEIAAQCAREFLNKIKFNYVFEDQTDIEIFRPRNISQEDIDKSYVELIDAAFNNAAYPIILKPNTKYMTDQYENMIPYIAYQDVIKGRCRVRAFPSEDVPTYTSTEGDILVEYDSTKDMVNDGWRID